MKHGRVVVGLALVGVVALRQAQGPAGLIVRSIPVNGFCVGMVADPQDGRIFAGCGGALAVIDTAGAALLPSAFALVTEDYDSMAVDVRRGRLVTGGYDVPTGGYISVLDAHSGALLHSIRVHMVPRGVIVDPRSGHILVGDGASIDVLDVAAGRVLRAMSISSTLTNAVALDPRTRHAFVITTDSAAPTPRGLVRMLDAASGRVLRVAAAGVWPVAAAVDERVGRVFIVNRGLSGPDGRSVSVVDTASGRVLATIRVGLFPSAVAVDARSGRVFIPNNGDNTVSVLDARNGRVLRTVHSGPNPSFVAVDERHNRVFVVNAGVMDVKGQSIVDGSVSVLDGSSGILLRTIPLRGSGGAIAVDERVGRAFVATGGNMQPRVSVPWGWLPAWLRHRLPFLPPVPAGARSVSPSITVIDIARL